MDAAEAMNHIARAVEIAMGEPVNSEEGAPPRGPWLPLSVRYGAAEAAAKVVIAWRDSERAGREVTMSEADDLARAIEVGFHVDETGVMHAAPEQTYVSGAEPQVWPFHGLMGAHVDFVGSWLDGDLRPLDGWGHSGQPYLVIDGDNGPVADSPTTPTGG